MNMDAMHVEEESVWNGNRAARNYRAVPRAPLIRTAVGDAFTRYSDDIVIATQTDAEAGT